MCSHLTRSPVEQCGRTVVSLVCTQAQLALPVLVVVQAVTPPFLLAGPLKRRRLEPWRGMLHATNVVFAVLLARFAIFDILQVWGLLQSASQARHPMSGQLLLSQLARMTAWLLLHPAHNDVLSNRVATSGFQ